LIGGWKSLSGSSTSISLDKFKTDYFNKTTKTFDLKKIDADGYKSFLLLSTETEIRQVSPDTKVLKDSKIITLTDPVKMGDYELTLQTSGVIDTSQDNFVITEVVYTSENNTKTRYTWSDKTANGGRAKIKELLTASTISIPTFFNIEVE
jgi:hypothetical protein